MAPMYVDPHAECNRKIAQLSAKLLMDGPKSVERVIVVRHKTGTPFYMNVVQVIYHGDQIVVIVDDDRKS